MAGTRASRALVAGLAPALLVALSAATPPAPVGIAAVVVKEVTLRAQGAAEAHPAKPRERVFLAEQVATGAASRLQILLLDQSSFTVGANARLTIDRFVYDPDQKSNFTVTLAKGAFRFMSGRNGHAATSLIKSPAASIGIRGTIVDGIVGQQAIDIARRERGAGTFADPDPETATLVVLRGPGARTTGRVTPGAMTVEAGGTTVEVDRPSLAVFVPRPGAQPIGPFQMSLPGLAVLGSHLLPAIEPQLTGGDQPSYMPPSPDRYRPIPRGPGFDPDRGPAPPPGLIIPNLPIPPRPAGTAPTPPPAGGQAAPNNRPTQPPAGGQTLSNNPPPTTTTANQGP